VGSVPTPSGSRPVSGRPGDLPPGALALLEAAKRLLMDRGFDALRLEAIAREAGVNKAMIRYYFGDKAGLVAALVDLLLHDATEALVTSAEALPRGDARVHTHVLGTRRMMDAPEFMAFFDVLPHALRDEELRRRIADLYVWYREMNIRCLGGDDSLPTSGGNEGMSRDAALAALFVAAIDGLAIQAALAPEGFDLGACLAALEEAMRSLLDGHTGVDDADGLAMPPSWSPTGV
jgi:AcrR family transcriptional regulator